MSGITVYISSVSGNLQIKKQQQYIQSILDSKKVEYTLVDIAADESARDHMRSVSGQGLIPQLFVNGQFKGGYEAFEAANEDGRLNEFFGLENVF